MVRNELSQRQQRCEARSNLGKKCVIDFALLKYTSSSLYQTNHLEKSVENCCDYRVYIVESSTYNKKE